MSIFDSISELFDDVAYALDDVVYAVKEKGVGAVFSAGDAVIEGIEKYGTKAVDGVCEVIDGVERLSEENPVISTVVTTAAMAAVSYVAAPYIAAKIGGTGLLGAASTGRKIKTIHGAARKSASLYKIGVGSVARGKAVISATSTVASKAVTKKRTD